MIKAFFSILGTLVAMLVIALILGFIGRTYDVAMLSIFNPVYEQVRYNTFTQSQAYNEGMERQLYDLKLQYDVTTEPAAKQGLRALILHNYLGYPNRERLPNDLRAFCQNLSQVSQ